MTAAPPCRPLRVPSHPPPRPGPPEDLRAGRRARRGVPGSPLLGPVGGRQSRCCRGLRPLPPGAPAPAGTRRRAPGEGRGRPGRGRSAWGGAAAASSAGCARPPAPAAARHALPRPEPTSREAGGGSRAAAAVRQVATEAATEAAVGGERGAVRALFFPRPSSPLPSRPAGPAPVRPARSQGPGTGPGVREG